MNECHFIGNLCRDPELKEFQSGTRKVRFTIAVSRKYKNKTTGQLSDDPAFLDMEAWDTGADVISEHFKKGDCIVITNASARTESWEDNEGKKRSKTVFRVNKFEFPRGNRRNNQTESDGNHHQEPATASVDDGGADVPF